MERDTDSHNMAGPGMISTGRKTKKIILMMVIIANRALKAAAD